MLVVASNPKQPFTEMVSQATISYEESGFIENGGLGETFEMVVSGSRGKHLLPTQTSKTSDGELSCWATFLSTSMIVGQIVLVGATSN